MSAQNVAQIRTQNPAPAPARAPLLTDAGNAQRIAEKYHKDLRYVPQRGHWMIYMGHAWHIDHLGQIMRFALEVTRDLMAEAAELSMQAARVRIQDEEMADELASRAEQLLRFARKTQQKSRLDAMLGIAQTEPHLVVSQDDLDANDWLLGVRNGVLDLKHGGFRPGEPEDLITRQAGCKFQGGWEDIECPTWNAFLEQIQPDADVRAWLQRFVGYCLTGSTKEQIFTVFHGVGANGKSVFTEMLRKLMGGYAATAQFETFTQQKQDAIRNDLAVLDKTRLVVAAEGQEQARLDEGIVKQITGGDPITARFLHREFFTYKPKFKVVLVSNHKPVIQGSDHGIWRRVVLVPFPTVIPREQQDRNLIQKLEAELPGILAWALQGLARYLEVGLDLPPALVKASAEYRAESDVLGQWLDEDCYLSDDVWAPVSDLYRRYRDWANENGFRAWSTKTFSARLRERGLTPAKRGGVRGWAGVALANKTDCPF